MKDRAAVQHVLGLAYLKVAVAENRAIIRVAEYPIVKGDATQRALVVRT